MSKKKITVMLTILLITILSASCFYVIEKGINPLSIFVNNYKVDEYSGDYEKVYGDKNAPYDDNDGKGKYFIRYNGKISKRKIVDLGKSGYGLTYENNQIKIFGKEITSTYKMFTQSNSLKTYANVERVILPAPLLFSEVNNTLKINEDGMNKTMFIGCNQDIDLIYHTPQLIQTSTSKSDKMRGKLLESKYDLTSRFSNQDNVIVYVYLGNENIDRSIASGVGFDQAYNGDIKNVFVGKEVDKWQYLFAITGTSSKVTNTYSSNAEMKYVLLDTDIDENNQKTLSRMFQCQKSLVLPKHFNLPINISSTIDGMFYYSGITKIPDGFKIPDTVESVIMMFNGCPITSLPSDFALPSTIKDMSYLFCGCPISTFPDTFEIPKTAGLNMDYAFSWMSRLREIITIPDNVSSMDSCFIYSGSSSNLDSYNTPIVMRYSSNCQAAVSYTTNVYTTTNTSGKVTKVMTDGDWEQVYDDANGIYNGDAGKYYIHYKGEKAHIDLSQASSDGAIQIVNNYPLILGKKIENTKYMFKDNQKIERVILPSVLSFKSDNSANEDGMNEEMFKGCNQDIDLIYHTPQLIQTSTSTNDKVRGKLLESKYDLTSRFSNQDNVIVYAYLGKENIDRSSLTVVGETEAYNGDVKNVFVGKEVDKWQYLFSIAGNVSTGVTNKYSSNKDMKYVLLDTDIDANNKKSLVGMFRMQKSLILPSHFEIPTNIETSLLNMFYYSGITSIPERFKIPEGVTIINTMFNGSPITSLPSNFALPSTIKDMSYLFCGCPISTFPDTFEIPKTAGLNIDYAFSWMGRLREVITIPDNVASMDSCFIYSGSTSNLDGYNTPIVMRYSSNCQAAVNYTMNVYTTTNTSGKVTKVMTDGDWEQVYDDANGIYNGEAGKYYIHYKGENACIDLSQASSDGAIQIVNNYPVILGKTIENTKYMFKDNQKIERVILPSVLSFKSDNSVNEDGMNKTMFIGCNQDIDLIYHTPQLIQTSTSKSDKMRGKLLESKYDLTSRFSNQDNVIVYVYLGNENIDRSIASGVGFGQAYNGDIKNVFVGKEVDKWQYLFAITGTSSGATNTYSSNAEMKYVLLDTDIDGNNQKTLSRMFQCQKSLVLPKHFNLPINISSTIDGMFYYSGITKIPDGFKIPDTVESVIMMFNGCPITSLPSDFALPSTIKNMSYLFCGCPISTFPDTFEIPKTAGLNMDYAFSWMSRLREIITIPDNVSSMDSCFIYSGSSSNLDSYNTPIVMRYSSNCQAAVNYTTNVYNLADGTINTSGKVTKELTDEESTNVQTIDIVSNENEVVTAAVEEETINTISDSEKNAVSETETMIQPIVIEDEMDWITITVNKKSVDEVVEETQENSQSVENVESENNEEGEIEE